MGKIINYDKNGNIRGNTMISIFEVARYFLSKESMSNLKLQKLCYYAQAWYYAINADILANTKFQAWVHGPVSPDLYQRYKQWGWYDIAQYDGACSELPPEKKEFLDKIYLLYGKYTGGQLEELTHSESAWRNARMGYAPGSYCTREILLENMKDDCLEKLGE